MVVIADTSLDTDMTLIIVIVSVAAGFTLIILIVAAVSKYTNDTISFYKSFIPVRLEKLKELEERKQRKLPSQITLIYISFPPSPILSLSHAEITKIHPKIYMV